MMEDLKSITHQNQNQTQNQNQIQIQDYSKQLRRVIQFKISV